MAANQHQAREDSREARWSDWELAMIPSKPSSRRGFERRGENQDGWIHSSIKDAFDGQAQRCGIYEWQARRFDQPNRVVYVGSTCPGKAGGLRKRILQYCTNESHMKDLINGVLNEGYELWVRVQVVKNIYPGGRENAQ